MVLIYSQLIGVTDRQTDGKHDLNSERILRSKPIKKLIGGHTCDGLGAKITQEFCQCFDMSVIIVHAKISKIKFLCVNPLMGTLKTTEQRTIIQQYSDRYTGR